MRASPVLAFLLFIPLAASAQESRGAILGRISDGSGAVVTGARVRATNIATNTGGSTLTNHEGNFEIPFLIPGTYRVSVDLEGFKKLVKDGVELSVDDRLALDLTLELGSVTETVVVTAEAPMLEASSPSIGVIVDDRQIAELPVAGGSAFYLSRLSPGVNSSGGHSPGNPFDQGHASGSIIVNGTRSGSSEVSLDGASNMSGTGSAYSPPQDLVQEFKIQTLAFDASLGHGTGAIVNVSIKAGTNAFHGSTYFFDSRIRATPWFLNNWLYNPATGPVTPEKMREGGNEGWMHQRWGDTLSGPIRIPRLYDGRNRSFFVFGYEAMYVRRTPTTTQTVPSPGQRDGDFSDLLALGSRYQIYDPYSITETRPGTFTRQPLAGNLIPAGQINPVGRKIAGYYPKPNAQGTSDGRNNFFRVYDEDKDYHSFLTRLDHSFNDSHRVFLRLNQSYYMQTIQTLPTVAVGNFVDRGVWGLVLDDVYVISPRFLLNLRYGFTYQNPMTRRFSQGFDLTSLGLPQSLVNEIRDKSDPGGIAFPDVTVSNYAALGDTGGSYSTTNYQTFFGTMTRLAGNHSLRWGGEYRLMRENGYNFGNVAPSFNFQPDWTKGPNQNSGAAPIGQGLAALLYGLPSDGQVVVNASRAEQSTFTGVFIQDDWKAARRLTVNLGVRYEYESPTTERFNRSIRGFDFSLPSPVSDLARANYAQNPIPALPADQFRTLGGVTFPGVGGAPRGLWTADKNNFAPRAGVAWQASSKTVIRSGYGIFHGLMGIDRQDVNQGGFNQITPFVASLTSGVTYRATLSDPFPDGIQRATGSSLGLRTQLGKTATYFDEYPLNHYMQRWTFSVQREVGHRTLVEGTYVGNRGTYLNASRQMNPVPRQYLSASATRDQAAIDFLGGQVTNPFYGIPEFLGTTLGNQRIGRSQLLKPYPQFSGITTDLPAGYSYYHSMQWRVQKRLSRGSQFQASYTWSKFMEATSYLNATDDRPEKVVSNQDHPHRFVISGIFELPVGRGRLLLGKARGWLQNLAGGWQAQGWYEGQSGQALGFGNSIFYGNLHDIPLPVSERDITRWFNADAGFERTSNRQLSNNIRTLSTRFNNVRGDGINNLDLSVFKTFRLTERWRAQFRAESYNALNHPQFNNPNLTPTSTAFGTVTSEKGHGQRQLTFAIKLLF
ncbi:MAG: TonB-dependent receptor [Bryobacterales bacterium]|nr:TonB-dependent receptor [Bryobacterales bacterium]